MAKTIKKGLACTNAPISWIEEHGLAKTWMPDLISMNCINRRH